MNIVRRFATEVIWGKEWMSTLRKGRPRLVVFIICELAAWG